MGQYGVVFSILMNTSWRDVLNVLCDTLDCTRYRAARIVASALKEGYWTE